MGRNGNISLELDRGTTVGMQSSGDGISLPNGDVTLTDSTSSLVTNILRAMNETVSVYSNSQDDGDTTVYNSSFAIPLATTEGQLLDEQKTKYFNHQHVLYIGSGISMFSIMIALFTYATSRKFRVKRPHMITINLCISLLIFYIGILLTASFMSQRRDNGNSSTSGVSAGCSAGAIFFQLGTLYSWTWITIHWGYLTYTVYNVAAPHISHFFIKVTLPAYGVPSLLTCFILIGNAVSTSPYIQQRTCFFEMDEVLVISINFIYIGLCLSGIIACVTYCIMRLTCRKNKNQVMSTHMRIKMSVIRLGVITLGVIATSVPELIRWAIVTDDQESSTAEIFNGVVLGTIGIVVVIGLLFRTKEFRIQWTHSKKGHRTIAHRAFNSVRGFRQQRMDSNGTNSLTLSPGPTTGVTTFDPISPPVRMVPRDSPALTSAKNGEAGDVFLFPTLERQGTLPGEGIQEENSKKANGEYTKQHKSSGRTHSRTSIMHRNGGSSTLERSIRKKDVSRISSIKKKVLRGSFHKSHRKTTRTSSSPSPAQAEVCTPVQKNSRVLDDNIEEQSSLSSNVDMYRKTSF